MNWRSGPARCGISASSGICRAASFTYSSWPASCGPSIRSGNGLSVQRLGEISPVGILAGDQIHFPASLIFLDTVFAMYSVRGGSKSFEINQPLDAILFGKSFD